METFPKNERRGESFFYLNIYLVFHSKTIATSVFNQFIPCCENKKKI